MNVSRTFLCAAMATALLASSSAYANEDEDHDKYAAIASAKLTLGQAIEAAQQNVSGNAFDAEFDEDDGKGVYEVKIADGDRVTEVKIDAASGKVLEKESEGLLDRLGKKIESVFGGNERAAAGAGLAQAVNAAEQSTQGKAVEAEIEERRNDRFAYQIKLVRDGWRKTVLVDPKTGEVLPERSER